MLPTVFRKESLKIAITGHIDHGKSTVIGRLLLDTRSLPPDKMKELQKISREFGKDTELAYLADQLKEERERNITIETTEIFFKTARRDYCLIDTPGHLEFIKNTLTGASHADAAILVIDANEGIKDQTRRHAYLIKLLSLQNAVILVNKMDLLDFSQSRFEEIKDTIQQFFQGLHLSFVQVIPVSAKLGVNISRRSPQLPWYRGPFLLQALDALVAVKPHAGGPLRLPVQDTLLLDGEEIVLGRLVSGRAQKGQRLLVMPSRKEVSLSDIRVFGQKPRQAVRGESVGLVLRPAVKVARGEIICDAGHPAGVPGRVKGNIFWLSERPLEQGATVSIRCSTQTVPMTVEQVEKRINPATLDEIETTPRRLGVHEAGVVVFRLLSPAVIEEFFHIPELGRFTIEQDGTLQGAGTVIETL